LVQLAAEYSSGKTIVSEHLIEEHRLAKDERIVRLFTRPEGAINPEAAKVIGEAEAVIFAPGDLLNSLIASLIITGVKSAIRRSRAKLIYVVNLMTLNSQTNYMTAADHVREIEKYAGKKMDWIVVNNQAIPDKILAAYAKQVEYPVIDDFGRSSKVVRRPLLAPAPYEKPKSDQLKRSLLRHDPDKLARAVCDLIG